MTNPKEINMSTPSDKHIALTAFALLLSIGSVLGTGIAAVWGLDPRWIATAALAGVGVSLVAAFIDSQLDRRAKAHADAAAAAEWVEEFNRSPFGRVFAPGKTSTTPHEPSDT